MKERTYRPVNAVKCGMGNTKVWGICFNQLDYAYRNWAAAVAGNIIIVIDVMPDATIALLEIFRDEDTEEEFFCVCWASNDEGAPLVCAAGESGTIRIINAFSGELYKNLVGHGGGVGDMRVHPHKRTWLLSGARDETVRLWNIQTGVMIAIFGGDEGHRGDVLSVDFYSKKDKLAIASCGMDKTVRLWQVPDELMPRVYEADNWTDSPSKFPTINIKYTISVESTLHSEFVDCVRWVGDFILSKAGNVTLIPNKIFMWDPFELEPPEKAPSSRRESSDGRASDDRHEHKRRINVINEYAIPRSHHWFNKFSMDFFQRLVACGNDYGEVFVYDIHAYPPRRVATLSNTSKEAQSQCRQVAVSNDGSVILSCHDNGQIWRWDMVKDG